MEKWINKCGKDNIIKSIKTNMSYESILKGLQLSNGPSNRKNLKEFIEFYEINVSHFDKNWKQKQEKKYLTIEKDCPICGTKFFTLKNHKKEKTTCSHSCANSFFRSSINNPNWKDSCYRTTCFAFHKKECVICGENKIVEVHHYDGDKKNNTPENLIPLCPTHHQYYHSKYKLEVKPKIDKYIQLFKV
jgi:hypothetical protein